MWQCWGRLTAADVYNDLKELALSKYGHHAQLNFLLNITCGDMILWKFLIIQGMNSLLIARTALSLYLNKYKLLMTADSKPFRFSIPNINMHG